MTRRFVIALALVALSCDTPTSITDGCRNERTFCDGRVVAPLSTADVRFWQDAANDYADTQYGVGVRAYPSVTWHACFFELDGGQCVAGWTESVGRIHVSTAEPNRTGPLVAHETLHTVYEKRFGDFDAHHRRKYGW